jgi:hypothetical protein
VLEITDTVQSYSPSAYGRVLEGRLRLCMRCGVAYVGLPYTLLLSHTYFAVAGRDVGRLDQEMSDDQN